jgi:hypothetical protein
LSYPKTEEYLFARCVIIAYRLIENRPYDLKWWSRFVAVTSHGATFQVGFLCEEFSLFSKDLMNVRRKFYFPEFNLLSGGISQIERMLVFSGSKTSKMFLDFALAFINGDDIVAHKQLKRIINETEKYGKLESKSERIANQLRSARGIVSLVSGVTTLIGGILALVAALLGKL